jgi:hypothetical protein
LDVFETEFKTAAYPANKRDSPWLMTKRRKTFCSREIVKNDGKATAETGSKKAEGDIAERLNAEEGRCEDDR